MQALTTQPFRNNEYLKSRIRSQKFSYVMIVAPCLIYIIGRFFERDITELIIPLFPQEKDKGFVFYQDFVRLCLNEMLWICLFFIIVRWLVGVPGRLQKRHLMISVSTAQVVVIVATFFCVTVATSWYVLETFPNSSDEYAYLQQAETLSKGKFAETAPSFPDAFHHNHIAIKDNLRVGRFPPGWPLLLSTAYLLHVPPWIINPLLGSLALLLLYGFGKKFYGEYVALWATLIGALSSYFIFNAASYFSHVSCLLAILGFVWLFKLYEEKGSVVFLICAGLCIGLVGVIRYYTAILVFLPFLFYCIYHRGIRCLLPLSWIALGSVPWITFLMYYNFSLTGNAFSPVTMWAYDGEQLGFVKGHTVLKGMEHLVRRLFMFIYWCSPGALLLYFVFLFQKLRSASERWRHPEDYLFISLLIGHFFYYQIGGNQYGPRFLFEATPFLAIFIARAVQQSRFLPAYAAFLIGGIIFSTIKIPAIMARESVIVDERQDLYDQVVEQQIDNAIVVVTDATSRLRPMPIGDLTRNGNAFQGDVLFIQHIPGLTESVMDHYNKVRVYRYSRSPDDVHGKLVQIR